MTQHYKTRFPGISVISDLGLTGDQPDRLVNMLYGNQHFDHHGQYTPKRGGPDAPTLTLKTIHFLSRELAGTLDGHSAIDGVDDRRFDASPFLYLENTDGGMTGWQGACQAVTSEWRYGVAVVDEDGQGWLYCRDTPGGQMMSEADPEQMQLIRISTETSPFVDALNGQLLDNLPAEGEFLISREETPMITSIPWWTRVDPEAEGLAPGVAEELRGLLDAIQVRIAAESSTVEMTL